MNRFNKERLKTIFILLLILTSILQVGILWGYLSQGTPTSFIFGLFKDTSEIDDVVAREKLFVPDQLVLCDGEKSHWILDRDDGFYEILWNEAWNGLKSIASGTVSLRTSNETWIDVVEKQGYLVDFGYAIKPELLKWFFGMNERVQELPDIIKLVVAPDIINQNSCTIYIYDANGRIYVSELVHYSREINFKEMVSDISDTKGRLYRNYSTLRGGKIDTFMDAEPDVLYITSAPLYWPYYQYAGSPPEKGKEKEEVAEIVLGNEKDRYNTSTDRDGTFQFTHGSNIYRYYSSGYLTYQYVGSGESSEKGNVGDALLNAYQFVARINVLSVSAADIVLTSVTETQKGVYEFGFDYRLNGMAVRIKVDDVEGSNTEITKAIRIRADDKRVLECQWLLRDFEQGAKSDYSDRFTELDLVGQTGLDTKDLHIKDMRYGYLVNTTRDAMLKPRLLMDMKDKSSYFIKITAKKGD